LLFADQTLSYTDKVHFIASFLDLGFEEATDLLQEHCEACSVLMVETVADYLDRKIGTAWEALIELRNSLMKDSFAVRAKKILKAEKQVPTEEKKKKRLVTSKQTHPAANRTTLLWPNIGQMNPVSREKENWCLGGPHFSSSLSSAANLAILDKSLVKVPLYILCYRYDVEELNQTDLKLAGLETARYRLHTFGLVFDGKSKVCYVCDPNGEFKVHGELEYVHLPIQIKDATTCKSRYAIELAAHKIVSCPPRMPKSPINGLQYSDMVDFVKEGYLSDKVQSLWSDILRQQYPDVVGLEYTASMEFSLDWANSKVIGALGPFLDAGKTCVQLHHVPGHFIVSIGHAGELIVFDTLNNVEKIKEILPILKFELGVLYCSEEKGRQVKVLRCQTQRASECLILANDLALGACAGSTPQELARQKPSQSIPELYSGVWRQFQNHTLGKPQLCRLPCIDHRLLGSRKVVLLEFMIDRAFVELKKQELRKSFNAPQNCDDSNDEESNDSDYADSSMKPVATPQRTAEIQNELLQSESDADSSTDVSNQRRVVQLKTSKAFLQETACDFATYLFQKRCNR
jgi:hypothetical protein